MLPAGDPGPEVPSPHDRPTRADLEAYLAFLFYETRLANWELRPEGGINGPVHIDLDGATNRVVAFHWPDDRRGAEPSWPSARALAVLGLLGLANPPEPHAAWSRELEGLRDALNAGAEDRDPRWRRLDEFQDLIVATPAASPAGVRAQLGIADVVLADPWEEEPLTLDAKEVRAALASLDGSLAKPGRG